MTKSTNKRRSGRKKHWFSSDRPIESAGADVLGRSSFAAKLAQSIGAWDGRDSLVIALHGGWGTGKTSVKNMVLEKLRGTPTRCPQIVEFSPWQVSGTGTLVGNFFDELGVGLGVDQKRKAGLFGKLSAYAKQLSFFGHAAKPVGAVTAFADPVAGGVIAAGGIAAEQSAQIIQAGAEAAKAREDAKPKSLANLKWDLGASLASLPRPVLVVIDDIDRLTTDEILQVFQLVKVNADFPNLVYLLLFERSIVERALDRISGERGHEFLQKIVQVEFHVPHAYRGAVEKVLFTELDKVIDHVAIKPLFDQDRWRSLYGDGIAKYFENLRHVYRFLGSFGFNVAQFKNEGSFEVNPVDLIGLEVLRVFEPGLYERLPSAKGILTRNEAQNLIAGIKPGVEIEAALRQLLVKVPENRQGAAKTILLELFPSFSNRSASDERASREIQKWLREHRVCHTDLFDKYFTLAVAQGDLSQAELDHLVLSTADREAFIGECLALASRGMLDVAFERLDAYKDEIPLTNLPALIPGLCDLSEQFPARKPVLFEHDLNVYAWRLVYFGLRREPDLAKRLTVLKDAFLQSAGLPLPLEIVSLDERDENYSGDHLIDEVGLKELVGICVEKIRRASNSASFRHHPQLLTILFRWSEWGDKSEVRNWISKQLKDEKGAVWLLRTLLLESSSTGRQGTRLHHRIDLRVVEQFSDLPLLSQLTESAKAENLEGLDRTALVEFRKALKRRAENRPDDDWRRDI